MEVAGHKEKSRMIEFDFRVKTLDCSNSSSSSKLMRTYGGGKTSKLNSTTTQCPRASPYKKRRKDRSQTQTVETTILTDDGYRWRKYGQKSIQNDIHPRCYYRCTYHEDDECAAKKWVQQVSNSPPVYRTQYTGHHSCKSPQIIHLPPDHALLAESSSHPLGSSTSALLWFEAPVENDCSDHRAVTSPPHGTDEAGAANGNGSVSSIAVPADSGSYSFPLIQSPTSSFGIDCGFDYGYLLDDVDSIPFHLL